MGAGWHARRFMGEGAVVPPDQVSLGVLVAAVSSPTDACPLRRRASASTAGTRSSDNNGSTSRRNSSRSALRHNSVAPTHPRNGRRAASHTDVPI